MDYYNFTDTNLINLVLNTFGINLSNTNLNICIWTIQHAYKIHLKVNTRDDFISPPPSYMESWSQLLDYGAVAAELEFLGHQRVDEN